MSETGSVVLRARGVRKHYGKGEGLVRAVDDVDLDVAPGETVAVMGPSGCGKSTLLHLLGGLDRVSEGEVWLAGRRIDNLGERVLARMRRTDVGFVFQAFHLMEELTASENVELAALERRLREAAHFGCDLAVATVTPGTASARNLIRAGFTVVARPIWRHDLSGDPEILRT